MVTLWQSVNFRRVARQHHQGEIVHVNNTYVRGRLSKFLGGGGRQRPPKEHLNPLKNYPKHSLNLEGKLWWILRPGITFRLKFADSSIFRVWTYKNLPRSIWYSPDLNTYILDEFDEFLSKRISSNYLCFWPFVGQSQIIIQIWLIIQKWPNFILEIEYSNLKPSFFCFAYYST